MSRNLKVFVEAEVHLSAEDLAKVFWAMDAEEQAGFFNVLGEIAAEKLPFQLQFVADSPHLTQEGRHTMALIGDYGVPF